MHGWTWERLHHLIRAEMRHLTTVSPSERRWQMPLAAALASGLPLMVGAYFDRLDYGLTSSVGGLIFLYLPATALHHRMVWLMACGFGMMACYALGVMSHFFPLLMMPVLAFIAILVSMVCRFYRVGPPGSIFFIMAATLGAYSPAQVMDVPLKVGLITMGCLLAGLIALFYSVFTLRTQAPQPVAPLPPATFDFVVFDSVMIGLFVGLSMALAQLLDLQRAYWVPVSCVAVIQGVSFRAVWNKQLQRIVGTVLGLALFVGLLALPLDKWTISLMVMALSFIVEVMIVRHYGFAVIFITPLTLFLADAATLGHGMPAGILQARLVDTIVGSLVGLAGGFCLHSPRFREVAGRQLRRLTPSRLLP